MIVDTAGRLQIDDALKELADSPRWLADETLLVVDAMTGQDAATSPKACRAHRLTGVVLSKLDGDARGGAAIGGGDRAPVVRRRGEGLDDLEPFYPDRMAPGSSGWATSSP